MAIPTLLPTSAREESVAGVTYHIEGELVPVLHLALGAVPVYFEHHILLWKDPHVQIDLKPLKGAFKRVMSGMPVSMTLAKGPGRIAFSRDGVGQVFAMHLKAGEAIDVREHQFPGRHGRGRLQFHSHSGRGEHAFRRDRILYRHFFVWAQEGYCGCMAMAMFLRWS